MQSEPHELFLAWAAKHKEAIDLEDRVNVARTRGEPQQDELRVRAEQARRDAHSLREQALARFHQELRDRGLEA